MKKPNTHELELIKKEVESLPVNISGRRTFPTELKERIFTLFHESTGNAEFREQIVSELNLFKQSINKWGRDMKEKKKPKMSKVTAIKAESQAASTNAKMMKALKPIIAESKAIHAKKGMNRYPAELQQNLVAIHYEYGVAMSKLAELTGIADVTIGYWKRALGDQMTHIAHGTTTRNDVRTKCLAVKQYLEENMSKHHLAEKYHVGTGTITAWVNRFQDEYKTWLDAPDGVQIVAKEERLIYGDKNIQKVRDFLLEQRDELRNMIETMQKHGIMPNAIKQAIHKEEEVSEQEDILKRADEILKKKK